MGTEMPSIASVPDRQEPVVATVKRLGEPIGDHTADAMRLRRVLHPARSLKRNLTPAVTPGCQGQGHVYLNCKDLREGHYPRP
jgi:hypothetical protein